MLSDIRLQHFRSYSDESYEFDKGVNIIVGPNASGKTNLLEAILVLTAGSSYRAKDRELLQFDNDWARLDADLPVGHRTVKLTGGLTERVEKQLELDDKIIKRISLQHTIPVVLFEPNHLLLLTGGPELRRDFLDVLLEQSVPGFMNMRRQYRRALSQRNALLKQQGPAQNLFPWNIRLSELGGQIASLRYELVVRMNKDMTKIYQGLSHTKSKVMLSYETSCNTDNYSSSLLRKLEVNIDVDMARGFTTHGPHRDDLVVELNGHRAEETASRGETRTLLLALKVLELRLLEEARDKKPILLLDDVFSELDGSRRKALTEVLSGYQTFITTTDADVVVQHFIGNCNIIPISKS